MQLNDQLIQEINTLLEDRVAQRKVITDAVSEISNIPLHAGLECYRAYGELLNRPLTGIARQWVLRFFHPDVQLGRRTVDNFHDDPTMREIYFRIFGRPHILGGGTAARTFNHDALIDAINQREVEQEMVGDVWL